MAWDPQINDWLGPYFVVTAETKDRVALATDGDQVVLSFHGSSVSKGSNPKKRTTLSMKGAKALRMWWGLAEGCQSTVSPCTSRRFIVVGGVTRGQRLSISMCSQIRSRLKKSQ